MPEHDAQHLEAQKEMNAGLFENVADEWLEETYPTCLQSRRIPPNTGRWPGMATNWLGWCSRGSTRAKTRGLDGSTATLSISMSVRPAQSGLARALIARSLQDLKDHGMEEAVLA